MKNKVLAIVALAATASNTWAQSGESNIVSSDYNPIPTSVQMLNIAPEARGTSMGDAGVASTPDINSQSWNPAKYVRMDSKAGAELSITPWLRNIISDINLFHLVGYYKINARNAVSASIKYFSLGELEFYNDNGDLQGNYDPNEFAIDAAYSLALSNYLSGSVALRFIHSDLGYQVDDDGYSKGNAFAADIAFYYKRPIKMPHGTTADLMFGINISNIGTKITYDNGQTNEYLPANLKLGVGFWYDIDKYNRIGATVDFNKLLVPTPNYYNANDEDYDSNYTKRQEYYDKSVISSIFRSFSDAPRGLEEELEEIDICGGIEYIYNNLFSARIGYHNNPENKGNLKYASAGLGVKYQMINVNASYIFAVGDANSNSALANTVRITLGFDIGNILSKNKSSYGPKSE